MRAIATFLVWLAVSWSANAQIAGLAASGLTPLPNLQHDGQTFYPNNFALGSTDPQLANAVYIASRMTMKSGSCTATAIKLGFTNSTIQQGTIGETTTATVATTPTTLTTASIKADFEISGTVTAFTFNSGATTTGTVAAGTSITWTDPMTVTLNPTTAYAIQTLGNSATGAIAAVRMAPPQNPMPTGSGSVLSKTTAPTQFGTAGPWTGLTANAAMVMPYLVIATTTATTCDAVFVKGDSHVTGQTDSGVGDPGDTNGYVGFPMRMLDKFASVPPFACACIGGNKVQSYSAPTSGVNTVEKASLAYVTNIVNFDLGNDIAGGVPAATVESYLSTLVDNGYTAGVKAAFVFIASPQTSSPSTGAGLNYSDYTHQTQLTNFGPSSIGSAVEAWIRAGVSAGGNAITVLDHVSGTAGVGSQNSVGTAVAGYNASYYYNWATSGAQCYGTECGGRHPSATIGNSYNIGAGAAYTQINPSSTAWGLLQ